MKRALLLVVTAALLLAGCGDDSSTETTTSTAELSIARLYFLRDGKIWPVSREIPEDGNAMTAILDELLEGPTEEEAEIDLTTAFADDLELEAVVVVDGVATLDWGTDLTAEQRAQLVYSLTEVDPAVQTVEIDGASYTRADFEEQTPSVLVESPLSFDEVASPLRAEGTANTFEATFAFTITDSDGTVLAENFVTATSGTGTRGTFELSESFTAPAGDAITLTVFENSAEDGSRIHEVEIPLTVAP